MVKSWWRVLERVVVTMSDLGNNQLELILFLWTRTFLFIFYRIIRERRKDFIFLVFLLFFQLCEWRRCQRNRGGNAADRLLDRQKLLLTHPFLLLSARVFQCCPIGRWRKTSVSFALHVCCVFNPSCPVCCSRSPAVHTNTCPFSTDGHCRNKWLVCEYFRYKLFFSNIVHSPPLFYIEGLRNWNPSTIIRDHQ